MTANDSPFRKTQPSVDAPESPVELLPLLTRREIPDVMPHQKEMLDAYAENNTEKDLAIQLPTGSGKTLVALLIAEWRRRKFKGRVVYLCPTRQLVHQTVDQAKTQYGVDAVAFTGPKDNYSKTDCTDYTTSSKVAVTTYSSLFNTNPFFRDPETIILDDAHVAENYIAKMWSLEIPSDDEQLNPLYSDLTNAFKEHISNQSYKKLTNSEECFSDSLWVDKLSSEKLMELIPRLIKIFDEHKHLSESIRFPWRLLCNHLHACHVYFSIKKILIRPLIPPTWSHQPFQDAKQRVYISATLGAGGDLERQTGREKIKRIEAPEGFRRSSVGRRFFIFPGLSLEEEDCKSLRKEMQKIARRSVVLTRNNNSVGEIAAQFCNDENFKIFKAQDIELSKNGFVNTDRAVAIMASRFDGLDFPHDECRLLCLDDLPKVTNAQESFLIYRMAASILFNERVQTRILQAIGRCTRALQDRSAVFITGEELQDYLTNNKNQEHFHPELQSEIKFGVTHSTEETSPDFIKKFESFMNNDSAWDEANGNIVNDATRYQQKPYLGMDNLESAVSHEIKYQKAIWNKDYSEALSKAKQVINELQGPSPLRAYRALWHYLCGTAAQRLSDQPDDRYSKVAQEQFTAAHRAAPTISWLTDISRRHDDISVDLMTKDLGSMDTSAQVKRLESELLQLRSTDKFKTHTEYILKGLTIDVGRFEEAQVKLGKLLGFIADNDEADGCPDPWWLSNKFGLVFEDHANATPQKELHTNKARQAKGHPNWLGMYRNDETKDLQITVVIVTPCGTASKGAKPHLEGIKYWKLQEFQTWAKEAINTVRDLKATLTQEGDFDWRTKAADKLIEKNLTLEKIIDKLPDASDILIKE